MTGPNLNYPDYYRLFQDAITNNSHGLLQTMLRNGNFFLTTESLIAIISNDEFHEELKMILDYREIKAFITSNDLLFFIPLF